MFPSPDNTPRPDPDDAPSGHGGAPRDPRIRLVAGNLRLIKLFEDRCNEADREVLSLEQSRELAPSIQHILAHILSTHPHWLADIQEPIYPRIFRIAETEDAYHVIGSISNGAATMSYFLDLAQGLSPLAPGGSAAFECRVPRALIEKSGAEIEEDDRNVTLSSLIDGDALTREIDAFGGGNQSGLFGTALGRRLRELERAPEQVVEVITSAPKKEFNTTAFLVRFQSHAALLEVFYDPRSGASNIGAVRFLSPGTRPTQDFFYDERTPDTVRSHLLADLSALQLQPIKEIEWVRNAKQMFGQALEQAFTDPATSKPVFVEVKQILVRREGDMFLNVLAEAELRRADRSFLVPTVFGGEMLRSPEPASLFYALNPIELIDGERHILYRLSHLALPPCGGIEGVVEALTKTPDRSILTEPLIAILGADLDLAEEEVAGLKLTAVIPLTSGADSTSIELSEENATSEREPVFIICAHTKGTHVVAINRTGSGLLNVVDDLLPLYFFPKHS